MKDYCIVWCLAKHLIFDCIHACRELAIMRFLTHYNTSQTEEAVAMRSLHSLSASFVDIEPEAARRMDEHYAN